MSLSQPNTSGRSNRGFKEMGLQLDGLIHTHSSYLLHHQLLHLLHPPPPHQELTATLLIQTFVFHLHLHIWIVVTLHTGILGFYHLTRISLMETKMV